MINEMMIYIKLMRHQYFQDCTSSSMQNAVVDGLEHCAGTLDRDGNGMTDPGKDACQGDSGGPLTCGRDGQPGWCCFLRIRLCW